MTQRRRGRYQLTVTYRRDGERVTLATVLDVG